MVLVFLALTMTSARLENLYLAVLAMAAVGVGVCLAGVYGNGDLFYHTYRVDLFSQVFKVLLSFGFFLIVCICNDLKGVDQRYQAEFYLLLALTTLAMMMLVSCIHLLTVYVALELSSYSLYLLVSLRSPIGKGTRTALNYFLIGATASAIDKTVLIGLSRMRFKDLSRRRPSLGSRLSEALLDNVGDRLRDLTERLQLVELLARESNDPAEAILARAIIRAAQGDFERS